MKQNSPSNPRRDRAASLRQPWLLRCPPRFRSSTAAFWILVTLLAGLWGLPRASTALAQGDAAEAGSLDESPSGNGSDGAAAPEPPQRTMLDTLKDGGVTGLLIILSSVVAVGFIIEHFLTIRKNVLMPEGVAEELEKLIHQGKINEAIEYCSRPEEDSLLSDVVLAGLQRYQASEFGFAEYKAAVEEAGEDQTARLYRKTEVLGVIGSIAPMLGLLGTVQGMIKSFNKIASTGGTAKPDQLAEGIGQALVTTLEGLIVAIPAMIAFSYFRNRIDSIVAETGKRVEQILMPLGRRRQ
ncbi:MAG: MotA/TolQ/ExbB proton channel family protein [Planctomycetes bacterium]|nr:MotA/TolQ/ExbB proton channel family protein [Planctomycetota bacterium]